MHFDRLAAVTLMAVCFLLPEAVLARRVPCHEVISKSSRLSPLGRKSRDPEHLARELQSDPVWVERCLQAYGRRVSQPLKIEEGRAERLFEQWERGREVPSVLEGDRGDLEEVGRQRKERKPAEEKIEPREEPQLDRALFE